MKKAVSKPLSEFKPWLAVAKAHSRALWHRQRLPPGKLVDIGALERGNRSLLLDYAQQHGPVFKGLMERRLVVCVVGHSLGRNLLRDHAQSLQAVSIQLESLFPQGFMRGMQGTTHRDYRKALVRGIAGLDMSAFAPRCESITTKILAANASKLANGASAHSWAGILEEIASSSLIELFFGPEPGSAAHDRLLAAYQRLGPHGVVWNVTRQQTEAYQSLLIELDSMGTDVGGLLAQLQVQGQVDSTLLGNLIYMVELGRYDLRGLMRWIARHAADQPQWLDQIAHETQSSKPTSHENSVAEAFVLETLRMDQSERLMRHVKNDFEFEGWLIPREAMIRVCMWEGHKDSQNFPDPFKFDPTRFLTGNPTGDQYSPFGLDHHHCPVAGVSVQLAAAFLRALAGNYKLQGQGTGPAVRGPYHWEPSPGFTISLNERVGASS